LLIEKDSENLLRIFTILRNTFNMHSAVQIATSIRLENLYNLFKQYFGWKIALDLQSELGKLILDKRLTNHDHSIIGEFDLFLTDFEWQNEELVKEGLPTIFLGDETNIYFQQQLENITKIYPKISIIIITYNNLLLTQTCLESIEKNTEYPNYELIIVDNKSIDGTIEFLGELKDTNNRVRLILNNENLGFAAANNQGAILSEGKFIVFLNNDTLVTPGWLHNLLLHLQKNPESGMVGPVTNAIGNEAKIDIDFSDLSELNWFSLKRTNKYFGESFKIKVLALYCGMISKELFFQLGGLDEQFRVGMFEDDDLAMKITQVNKDLICAEDVFIYHVHGASFNKIEEAEIQRIFHENRARFENKWGVKWVPHQHRN